jgi:hypothetical protein
MIFLLFVLHSRTKFGRSRFIVLGGSNCCTWLYEYLQICVSRVASLYFLGTAERCLLIAPDVGYASVLRQYVQTAWTGASNTGNLHLLETMRGCIHKFSDWPPGARTSMAQLSATRCSCIAILWVSLVSFATITLYAASQRVFIFVFDFFIDSVRKLLDTPSYSEVPVWVYMAYYIHSVARKTSKRRCLLI